MRNYAKVGEVRLLKTVGTWPSKSGGTLTVLLDESYTSLSSSLSEKYFFGWNEQDAGGSGKDIRGLRVYTVSDIPVGKIGANEYHKVRSERIYTLAGVVKWTFEDLYGHTREVVTHPGDGVEAIPYVMHTYEALEGPATLFIVANACYDPNDILATSIFEALQQRVMREAAEYTEPLARQA